MLTRTQSPCEANDYVIQNYHPNYYIINSDNKNESDFKYIFKLYDKDGFVTSVKNSPYYDNGMGVFNSSDIIRNNFDILEDFQPAITNFTKCSNSIYNYYVHCYEDFDGTEDNEEFRKVNAINSRVEGFDFTDYLFQDNEDGKFLTNRKIQTVKSSDMGTLRFLNGYFRYGYTVTDYSKIYEIRLEVYKEDGTSVNIISIIQNPYYGVEMDSNPYVVEDTGKFLLDIPLLPYNLNKMNWKRWVAGEWFSYNLNLECGDWYYIHSYTWPYGDSGINSEKIKVIIDGDGKYSSRDIQLGYSNILGGFDYLTCRGKNDELISIDKTIYNRNKYEKDGFDLTYTSKSRGRKIIANDIKTSYTVRTHWLEEIESENIRDLWVSEEVFMRKGTSTTWYPVILDIKSINILRKGDGLISYEFDIGVSNKNIMF